MSQRTGYDLSRFLNIEGAFGYLNRSETIFFVSSYGDGPPNDGKLITHTLGACWFFGVPLPPGLDLRRSTVSPEQKVGCPVACHEARCEQRTLHESM